MQRREFLSAAGAASAGALAPQSARAHQGKQTASAAKPLKILMLGGTGFLGPTIVEAFLERGHEVTCFNRGITNPDLFLYLEKLRGDRESPNGDDLSALKGRDWDIVIDTWQKGPKCVEDTARLLSGRAGAYFYVSSISVYHSTGFGRINTDETGRLSDYEGEPVTRDERLAYYLRKNLAEDVLAKNFDGAVGLFRSHGMRGERHTGPDSESYWPVRIWRGGDVLAPEDGMTWGQFTDTVSLARFMVHCAEVKRGGAFNVMSQSFRLKEFFEAIKRVTKSDANFIWTPREKLAEFGIEPYRDLPMWRPEPIGFYRFSNPGALAAGFEHRSLEACAASMLEGYLRRHPRDDHQFGPPRGEISAGTEVDILAALARPDAGDL